LKELTNQTLYQCDYCGKRLLSKNGAKVHEEQYCRVVLEKKLKEQQANCTHEKTAYSYRVMVGEDYVQEPDYLYCVECDKKKHPFKGWDYDY